MEKSEDNIFKGHKIIVRPILLSIPVTIFFWNMGPGWLGLAFIISVIGLAVKFARGRALNPNFINDSTEE